MPENAKKQTWLIVGVSTAVILLIIGVVVFRPSRNNGSQPNNALSTNPVNNQLSSTTASSTENTTTVKVAPIKTVASVKAGVASKAYLDAVKKYKTIGYYFQFLNCHGAPGTLSLKVGSKIMFDNRDNVSRKIGFMNGAIYNVPAYGFVIATVPYKPATYYITCNGGGAATVNAQK